MKKFNKKLPLIGIIPDYKDGEVNGYSPKSFYALRTTFVEAISQSKGLPLVIPYCYNEIENYLDLIDGLLITGGNFDIDPKTYGEDYIHPTTKLNLVRSEYERAFVTKALEREKLPIFGVCNGMQLLSVLHGGKLIQHIPDEVNKNYRNHEQSRIDGFEDYSKAYHKIKVAKKSKLNSIIGEEEISTNSSHHQAVAFVGPELDVVAYADDGIIEAVEKPQHPFCIGVQWHPELNSSPVDIKIFNAFIAKAQEYSQIKL